MASVWVNVPTEDVVNPRIASPDTNHDELSSTLEPILGHVLPDRLDDLQRDLALEPRVLGEVDHTLSTTSELFEDGVWAEGSHGAEEW